MKQLFTKHKGKVLLAISVTILTIIVLFYTIENWRGMRNWQQVKHSLRAQGEPLYWQEVEQLHQAIPPAANRAEASILAELFTESDSKEPRIASLKLPDPAPKLHSIKLRAHKRNVFSVWAKQAARSSNTSLSESAAAQLYLEQHKHQRPLMDALAIALERPDTRWPLNYQEGFELVMPHIGPLMNASRFYSLQAQAHLQSGQASDALACLAVLDKISESFRHTHMSMIEMLVAFAIDQMKLGVIAYGIEHHKWSPGTSTHLQKLIQPEWDGSQLRQSLRVERIMFLQTIENLNYQDLLPLMEMSGQPNDMTDFWAGLIFSLRPKGWVYQDLTEYTNWIQQYIEAEDFQNPAGSQNMLEQIQSALEAEHQNFYYQLRHPLTLLSLSPVSTIYSKQDELIESYLLVATALALVDYHTEHGQYPQALGQLPADINTTSYLHQQPFKYQVVNKGYRLFTRSRDGKDTFQITVK